MGVFSKHDQLPIFRSKIIYPIGNRMSFIDSKAIFGINFILVREKNIDLLIILSYIVITIYCSYLIDKHKE